MGHDTSRIARSPTYLGLLWAGVCVMPVLGHAFVGLAIGVSARPAAHGQTNLPDPGAESPLWLPAVVTLAYLPDMVSQIDQVAGWIHSRLAAHSILFAVVLSPAIGAALTRLTGASFPRACLVTLISLPVHDGLDLAQATDRAPWWPLSDRPVSVDLIFVPTNLMGEAALFGGLLLAFLAIRVAHRSPGRRAVAPAWPSGIAAPAQHRLDMLGRLFILAVIVAAVAVHSLRATRENAFETARALVGQRAYRAALDELARADPWPSTAKPGRVDYLRGEAYAGMGDRDRAESYYRRAYEADPMYFWVIADLASFYASSPDPVADRCRRVQPYLDRLRRDFPGHPAFAETVTRIEQRLAAARLGHAPSPLGPKR